MIGQHGLGSLNRSRQYPHAITQPGAVDQVVDGALHHRAADAQLAPMCDVVLAGQLDHPVMPLVQHRRLDQIGPSQQGDVARHRLKTDATELAQYQAAGDKLTSLIIAPAIQVLEYQQAQG